MKFSKIFMLALMVLLASHSQAFAVKTIKLAHNCVVGQPQYIVFEKFKKILEERSNGAFKVDILDSGKYGDSSSIMKGLQMGVLQIGAESTANFSVFDQRLMLFDLPYLIPNYEAAELILTGPVGKTIAKGLEEKGVVFLGYHEIGFRHLFNNKKVTTLEEAKGLKVRATLSQVHLKTLASLGMNPTPMAFGETYTGLQQKTIDAVDFDLNLVWFFRFYEVLNSVTLSQHMYSPHIVLMSKRFWQTLSPEEQKLISEIMAELALEQRTLNRSNEQNILEKLQSEYKVNVTTLPDEEKKRWIDSTKNVASEFKDIIPKDLLELTIKTINDAGLYK